jgi:tetratricopeptide (TPR) repeat protein
VGLDEFRVYGLMRLGRSDEALQLARELAASRPRLEILRVLLSRRQYGELLEYVESRWADLDAFEADFPERDGWNEHNYFGIIAYAYQRTGNDEMFQDALRRFAAALDYQRQIGASNRTFTFAEAMYAVLAGDHDTAHLKLARAIEGGVSFDPDLTNTWPMFAALEDDPGFQATMKRMLDHLNSERAKLGLGPVTRQPAFGPHGI